ncbi:MAG: hypothetical protein ACTSXA_00705 [Candidatus Heimdallarchaeota archaeon]
MGNKEMLIFRAKNTEVLEEIKSFLTGDIDYEMHELEYYMQNHPNDIFVNIAYDGSELIAFLICWKINQEINYAWMSQAYVKSGTSKKIPIRMLEDIKNWLIEEKNCTEIRAETTRNVAAFEKRWGFKQYAVVMQYLFNED